jgi:hypothetical protein
VGLIKRVTPYSNFLRVLGTLLQIFCERETQPKLGETAQHNQFTFAFRSGQVQ